MILRFKKNLFCAVFQKLPDLGFGWLLMRAACEEQIPELRLIYLECFAKYSHIFKVVGAFKPEH